MEWLKGRVGGPPFFIEWQQLKRVSPIQFEVEGLTSCCCCFHHAVCAVDPQFVQVLVLMPIRRLTKWMVLMRSHVHVIVRWAALAADDWLTNSHASLDTSAVHFKCCFQVFLWHLSSFLSTRNKITSGTRKFHIFDAAHLTCQLLFAYLAWDKTIWMSWTSHKHQVNLYIHSRTGLLRRHTQWQMKANLHMILMLKTISSPTVYL